MLFSNDRLTVFSVCTGDKYESAYVYALRDMVAEFLTVPHDFVCLTTRKLPGILTRNPPVPFWGWWSKIGLFYPGVSFGPSLFFDLDVVIVRNIDYMVKYTNRFSAPTNFIQSGHGGLQSSVIAWPGNWTLPFDNIRKNKLWPEVTERFHGDQEYLYSLIGDDYQRLPGVCSYKYHCRPVGKIPMNYSVVLFHGEPKPHAVTDKWISQYIRITRSNINANTPNVFAGASKGTG